MMPPIPATKRAVGGFMAYLPGKSRNRATVPGVVTIGGRQIRINQRQARSLDEFLAAARNLLIPEKNLG
jgi:hypothetical protein